MWHDSTAQLKKELLTHPILTKILDSKYACTSLQKGVAKSVKGDPELLSYWPNCYIRSTTPTVLPCHPQLIYFSMWETKKGGNKKDHQWKKGLMRSTDFTPTHFEYNCSLLDMQSTLILVFCSTEHDHIIFHLHVCSPQFRKVVNYFGFFNYRFS